MILISLLSAALTVSVGYILVGLFTPISFVYVLALGGVQIISLMVLSYVMNECGCKALFMDKENNDTPQSNIQPPLPGQPSPPVDWSQIDLTKLFNATPSTQPIMPPLPPQNMPMNQMPLLQPPLPTAPVRTAKTESEMTPEEIRQMFACVCEIGVNVPPPPAPTLKPTVIYPSMTPVVLPSVPSSPPASSTQTQAMFDFCRMFSP